MDTEQPTSEATVSSKPTKLPSAFSLFTPSKDAVIRNIWTFVGLSLLPAVPLIFSITAGSSANGETGLAMGLLGVGGLLALILGLIMFPAISLAQLQAAKGTKVDFVEVIKAGLPYLWRMIGLAILTGLVIFVGFLLLIVPGFIMIRRYMLAPFYLLDRDLKVGEAMRQSAADSGKFAGAIWGVIGVSILFALVGIVPILGQLASTVLGMLYSCAPALRYLQIKQASN